MATSKAISRRRRQRIAAIAALALVALAATYVLFLRHEDSGSAAAAPVTETVKRGDVRSTVAGVGTLEAEQSVNLAFGEGGRVKSVAVSLGDEVKAGQVLAQLDDGVARSNLNSATAQVAAAEAKLAQLSEGHTPQELNKVRVEEVAARGTADDASRSAQKAGAVADREVESLTGALSQEKKGHQAAEQKLAKNRARLAKAESRAGSGKAAVAAAKAKVERERAQLLSLAATREADRKKAGEEEAAERKKIQEDEKKERQKAEEEGREYQSREATVIQRNTDTGTYAETLAQSQLETAQTALTEAQTNYEKWRTEAETLRGAQPELRDSIRTSAAAVASAEAALSSGRASAALSKQNAEETAAAARRAEETTLAAGASEIQPAKSGEMAEAAAAISQAEATLASSEKSLRETVLRAPTDGRVSSLKLSVGDVVSGGQTSQAKVG